jgi:hypothetical protein
MQQLDEEPTAGSRPSSRAVAGERGFRLTVLRPEGVIGYAVGNPMNLLMVIAVYAGPQPVPLAEAMADRRDVRERLAARHDLVPTDYADTGDRFLDLCGLPGRTAPCPRTE